MSYTLQMFRFPAELLGRVRHDRAQAQRLALDGGPEAVGLDFGKREDEVYRLLRPEAPEQIVMATRPDDPLAHALVGSEWLLQGRPIIDTGYGTPHVVLPDEVRAIASLLAGLDVASLQARAQRFAYGSHLVARALELRQFYAEAAAEGQAVVITPC